MPRSARHNYPGVIHHVIQRGNNKEFVFADPSARDYFVSLLRQAVRMDGAQILAYVVMNNHFHLAMRDGEKPLGKIMHRINTTYSLFYNSQKARTGHVFQGRFKAIPILDEHYLLAVIRYIHRNPVAAHLTDLPQEYLWSSDRNYRGSRPDFVACDLVLDSLANERQSARERYNVFMREEDEVEWEDFARIDDDSVAQVMEESSAGRDAGTKSNITLLCSGSSPMVQVETESFPGRRPDVLVCETLDEILRGIGTPSGDWEAIKSGSRLRQLQPYKTAFARAAFRQGYSMEQIAHYLSLTATSIYHYLK